MSDRFSEILEFVRGLYPGENPVPLHAPRFLGREKEYLDECIDSTFVSYVGPFVSRFERLIADYVGVREAVVVVSGTEALHIALLMAGVRPGDEVITQALTFVATANAVRYCGADPVFVDVDRQNLGLAPAALESFLLGHTRRLKNGDVINTGTGRRIAACVPVHAFGHPASVVEIISLCDSVGIPVVEDAAESLGSLSGGRHTGSLGSSGILSFNGNKVVTCGGGGALITDDGDLARRARHITTTAKCPHPWEFVHDEVAFNYRMPNINAAVGCAQLERLDAIVENKRATAACYMEFFATLGLEVLVEPAGCRSNYWLNGFFTESLEERDRFLTLAAQSGVQARPAWRLMTDLPMFAGCAADELAVSRWVAERLVSLPSSIRLH